MVNIRQFALALLATGVAGMALAQTPSADPALPRPSAAPAPTAAPTTPAASTTSAAPTVSPQGDGSQSTLETASEIQAFLVPFIYQAEGRRDPFQPYKGEGGSSILGPLLPLQKYDVSELHLIGVLWDVRAPRAMVLDPNKEIHILGKDDRIGRNNGYVAVIREGELVVIETINVRGENGYTTRVMKIDR